MRVLISPAIGYSGRVIQVDLKPVHFRTRVHSSHFDSLQSVDADFLDERNCLRFGFAWVGARVRLHRVRRVRTKAL